MGISIASTPSRGGYIEYAHRLQVLFFQRNGVGLAASADASELRYGRKVRLRILWNDQLRKTYAQWEFEEECPSDLLQWSVPMPEAAHEATAGS